LIFESVKKSINIFSFIVAFLTNHQFFYLFFDIIFLSQFNL